MKELRVECSHTDDDFLEREQLVSAGRRPTRKGTVPTLCFGFAFCIRNNRLAPVRELWGLLDSGAEMSAIPAFWIEGPGFGVPGQLVDPERRRLRGLNGVVVARVYYAAVSLSQRSLVGRYCGRCRGPLTRKCPSCDKALLLEDACPKCGRRLSGHFCQACRMGNGSTVFRVAAVDGLDYPAFGRDLLSEALTVVDPWRLRTTVVDRLPGRRLGGMLRWLPGTRLTPNLK
jgi:hypothetical protein